MMRAMAKSDAEWAAWAKQHKVAFEVVPLVELRGKEKLQVGFTLNLYGAVPMELPPGDERERGMATLMEELGGFVAEVAASEARGSRIEPEAPRAGAVLRPENELHPEVSLSFRIFHSDEYMTQVTDKDREGLSRVEKIFTAKGLKHGHW